jgi:hypothetical protein
METREDTERTILEIIYAENSTPAAGVALAKQCGVQAAWFTTCDRRLLWLIAGAARDREHALTLKAMAMRSGDIVEAARGMECSWFWSPHRLMAEAAQLRGFKMKAGMA